MEVQTYNSCRLNIFENTASGSTSIPLSLISLETTKTVKALIIHQMFLLARYCFKRNINCHLTNIIILL